MTTSPSEVSTAAVDVKLTLQRVLEQAIGHHRSGDITKAERLYRSILAQDPNHADAHHNLGILVASTGDAVAALPHFQAAIQANPHQGQYWLSCIDVLVRSAQLETASKMLELGVESGLRGDAVQALRDRLYRLASASISTSSDAGATISSDAAHVASQDSTHEVSRGAKRKKVVSRKRRQKMARLNGQRPSPADIARLRSLFEQGCDVEMEALARSLSARFPKSGYSWNLLGALRQRKGCFSEARALFQRALQADPDCVEAHFNLGRMLQQVGELGEADGHYRRAIELYPDFLEAHYSLGESLNQRGRFADAEGCYRRVIQLRPRLAVAHNNLAITLRRQDRPREAEASCRRAIELNPEFAEAFCNLGTALKDQGKLAEAAEDYRRAIQLQPNLQVAHHGLLFCLSHSGEIEPDALFAEHLRFAERFEVPLQRAWLSHPNSLEPNRQLRVGFVSGDFRQHSMAHFLLPLFSHLANKKGLSLFAYSNSAVEDAVTDRMRGYLPHWNRVFTLSDDELAAKVRADGIDILIDLTGHTAGSRLLTFARKPAPVQCSWIGYLGTSGLRCIDYYLADRHFLPPGEFERHFSEKIVYLSAVAPFEPSLEAPPINQLPAMANGYLTFASFSRLSKLSRQAIALWAQLLRALPESRLLVGAMPRDGQTDAVRSWLADEEINPERLQFHPRCSTQDYLALHHQIDICLDPFPFTGATTTCQAMWMGVPTLVLLGSTVPGRLGPALLEHAGLGDFVARDPQDFIEKGKYWAQNLESLAQIRSGLRERFLASPIGQPADVAESFAAALRQMWRNLCESSSSVSD
jgi:protein O-GlcNAc transferase